MFPPNILDQLKRWRFSKADIAELDRLCSELIGRWEAIQKSNQVGFLSRENQDLMGRIEKLAERRNCVAYFSIGDTLWVRVSKNMRRPWRMLTLAGDGAGKIEEF